MSDLPTGEDQDTIIGQPSNVNIVPNQDNTNDTQIETQVEIITAESPPVTRSGRYLR